MNFRSGLLLLALSVLCMCAVHAVPICLGVPGGVGGGASCSGLGDCAPGFYCSNTSICTAFLPVGTACKSFDVCATGSDCRGPTGNTLCVAFANPGESCSLTNTVTTPRCGTGDCSNNVCRGGLVNDTCASNLDCVSRICDGKYCVGFAVTLVCQYSEQCAPGLFCKKDGNVNGTCASLLTTGVCNSVYECAPGYVCEKQSPNDQTQCFPFESKNPGDYCGNSPMVCKGSKRCLNNYCAKSAGETCSPGGCSADQVCTCGGLYYGSGTGSCSGSCARSASLDLHKCLAANCQGVGQYSGSCVNRLCKGQYEALDRCSGASALTFSFSALLISTFLAVFFTKF